MPKIIENLKPQILKEAKRQVFENGYTSLTLRSVAKSCHIAVGTIYNYFQSKEILVAAFILEDWLPIESDLRTKCKSSDDVITSCHYIYDGLLQLEAEYRPLFKQDDAIKSVSTVYPEQHRRLRRLLAGMLEESCLRQLKSYSDFLPEFLAESLLAWSSEKRDFADLEAVFNPLIHMTEAH